ncbi:MAG: hypothetical protein ABR583_11875 [Gaiellaceae bacterium]
MSGRALRLTAGAAALVSLGVAAAVIATAGGSGPPGFERLSNSGHPVDTAQFLPRDRAELELRSITEVRLVASREGVRFYRAAALEGECLITSLAVGGRQRFGEIACTSGFPSRENPVADLTPLKQGLDESYPRVVRLAGFAADAVAAVGLRSPSGKTRWVQVSDNVYVSPPLGMPAAALLYRGEDGEILRTVPLGGSTLREQYGGQAQAK